MNERTCEFTIYDASPYKCGKPADFVKAVERRASHRSCVREIVPWYLCCEHHEGMMSAYNDEAQKAERPLWQPLPDARLDSLDAALKPKRKTKEQRQAGRFLELYGIVHYLMTQQRCPIIYNGKLAFVNCPGVSKEAFKQAIDKLVMQNMLAYVDAHCPKQKIP